MTITNGTVLCCLLATTNDISSLTGTINDIIGNVYILHPMTVTISCLNNDISTVATC